jgi:hypothetical protein
VKLVIGSRADHHDGGRRPGHVPGTPPDLGQLAELLAIGDEDEVPRLPVL